MRRMRKYFVFMTLAASLLAWGCQREETRTGERQRQQPTQQQQQQPGQTESGQQQPGQGQ